MRLAAWESTEVVMGVVTDSLQLIEMCSLESFYADVEAGLAQARDMLRSPVEKRGLGLSDVRLAVPVPQGARVLCAGVNYPAHAAEASGQEPRNSRPDIFARWRSTLVGSGSYVRVPVGEQGLDWEGELAAVVGRPLPGGEVSVEVAGQCLLGYTCFNDLSAREYQFAGKQAGLGKNADDSGPIGPWIVTTDELGPAPNVRLQTVVNGKMMQDAMTGQMIWSAPAIMAYAAGVMSLRPGDVISTGTPEGVGWFRNPRRLLQSGDRVSVTIDRVGTLQSQIC